MTYVLPPAACEVVCIRDVAHFTMRAVVVSIRLARSLRRSPVTCTRLRSLYFLSLGRAA